MYVCVVVRACLCLYVFVYDWLCVCVCVCVYRMLSFRLLTQDGRSGSEQTRDLLEHRPAVVGVVKQLRPIWVRVRG